MGLPYRRSTFYQKVFYNHVCAWTLWEPWKQYAATRGERLIRTDLCAEAIRLGRLVRTLMAPQPPWEATALLALMLLHDARREPRMNEGGDIVLLEEQDRSQWNQRQIAEAMPLVAAAMLARPGSYALQAAIAAEHCKALKAEDTDWREILRLYELLERVQPSPIVSLNRAVAVAGSFLHAG